MRRPVCQTLLAAWLALGVCALSSGCLMEYHVQPVPADVPRELDKVTIPYHIEPSDILVIDAVRVIPRPPYRIEPLDQLYIRATGTLEEEPINDIYVVEPEGAVNLGPTYGVVRIVGMTTDEAKVAIEKQLIAAGLKEPQVWVALAQFRGVQQIRGEHLVRIDGTVSLGTYGSVYVTGMTVQRAREAVEAHLSQFLINPKISLDVFSYNTKYYYVIFDGGGAGQPITRLPYTGTETVLDAISLVNGLPTVSSTKRIWVARPAPSELGCQQILPVNWEAITCGASTATNYQLLPGDRIYVKADPWIAFDTALAKIISPFERMLGFTLLGNTVGRAVDGQNTGGGF